MLEDQWKALIKQTVQKYMGNDVQVFIFGSRATGTNRKWSDVDIGVLGQDKVPGDKLFLIEDDIADTDIPYRVDVVDFKTIAPEFAKVALSSIINL
mgnify:CR=1 FL=1